MKPSVWFSTIALVALTGACVPVPGPSMTGTHAAAIRDSVQTTLEAFQRYSANGQWDSLAGLYADDEDFRWLEQGMIQYRSQAQIREALRRVAPGTRIETSFLDRKVYALAPGVGGVSTTFYTKYIQGDDVRTEYGGVLDMTLVHRPEGWRILYGHSSSAR